MSTSANRVASGKTAAELLLKAARYKTIGVSIMRAQHSSRRYGVREANAAAALQRVGLLDFVEKRHRVDHRAGFSTHFDDAEYRITDAGRAALAGKAQP